MWGYGTNYGWTWLLGLLMLAGLVLLVLLAVRVFSGGRADRNGPPGYGEPGYGEPGYRGAPGRTRARDILDERFAKGELTAEQYREQLRVLDENR